ncbi:MAG: hypothetical protein LBC96_07135 [Lachnospiraceae bacterium]|jgi:hypothetical protein|nr:hypothetical protein [Lachnospiraceae bacterium]
MLIKSFFKKGKLTKLNNEGLGTIEIILILVVLIGLVVIFRQELLTLIGNIFDSITAGSNKIIK